MPMFSSLTVGIFLCARDAHEVDAHRNSWVQLEWFACVVMVCGRSVRHKVFFPEFKEL